jgi:hypothetical protein
MATRELPSAVRVLRHLEDERPPRPVKDPRDFKILDPACGSGHFLLYCFDLLDVMYREAWERGASREEASGQSLRDSYPTVDELERAIPSLIVERNLHGVDIDPRAAQIAALAIWLRAQRAWRDAGIDAADRPRVRKTGIVVAEPMPGDPELISDFARHAPTAAPVTPVHRDGAGNDARRRNGHAAPR